MSREKVYSLESPPVLTADLELAWPSQRHCCPALNIGVWKSIVRVLPVIRESNRTEASWVNGWSRWGSLEPVYHYRFDPFFRYICRERRTLSVRSSCDRVNNVKMRKVYFSIRSCWWIAECWYNDGNLGCIVHRFVCASTSLASFKVWFLCHGNVETKTVSCIWGSMVLGGETL